VTSGSRSRDEIIFSGSFRGLISRDSIGGATSAMCKDGWSVRCLHRVQLTVLPHNEHAIGLYKQVGFIEEGRTRQAIFKDGKYIDLIQMAILSGEYRHIDP
jgi:RimJ/RimL family protein N-acetyltransferase